MKDVMSFCQVFCNTFVETFGFLNVGDFINSLVHTKFIMLTLPTSFILFGVIEEWLGITSSVFISFGLMSIVELITGLWSSRIRNLPWSSKKFSRFGLKLFVWLSLIMVANSFKISYANLAGIQNMLIHNLFHWIHGVTVVYVAMEYMISIMENLSRITGKKDNKLLAFLKKKLDQFLGIADEFTTPKSFKTPNEVLVSPKEVTEPVKIDLDSSVVEDKPKVIDEVALEDKTLYEGE